MKLGYLSLSYNSISGPTSFHIIGVPINEYDQVSSGAVRGNVVVGAARVRRSVSGSIQRMSAATGRFQISIGEKRSRTVQ